MKLLSLLCLLLCLLTNHSKSQQCTLTLIALDVFCKQPRPFYIVRNDLDKTYSYYVHDLNSLKTSLSRFVPIKLIDSVLNYSNEKNDYSVCSNTRLRLIDSVMFDSIAQTNRMKFLDSLIKEPSEEYTIFIIPQPLVFKNYIVIEITSFITPTITNTKVFLFKKNKEKYDFIELLMSSAG